MATATFGRGSNEALDTYINSGTSSTNFGTATVLWLGSFFGSLRVLIEFDISSLAGATVTACKLTLNCTVNGAAGAGKLSRILRSDWSETQATWDVYKTSNNWTTAGCASDGNDFTSTNQVSYSAISGTGDKDFTGLATLAQDAIDNRSGKLRLRIKDDTEASFAYYNFASANHATSGNRPLLTVDYTPAAGGAGPTFKRSLLGVGP